MALLTSVRTAFVHGMDLALAVSGGIAVVGVVLTVIFLPTSNAQETMAQPGPGAGPQSRSVLPSHDRAGG